MDNVGDRVMVALVPIISDGFKTDYPHLTLVYAGEASGLTTLSLDGLSKAAASIALLCNPVTLRVLTKDVFGDGTEDSPKVDVLRFHPNLELVKMRAIVEDWNASAFPFNPHVTIGPEGSWQGMPPSMIAFDRVSFSKGNERQEFQMSYQRGGVDYG